MAPEVQTEAPAAVTPSLRESNRNSGLKLMIGLVAPSLALGGAYWLWRPGRPTPMPAWARQAVATIAALDADFEAGRLAQDPYSRRRANLKRQLQAERKRREAGGRT